MIDFRTTIGHDRFGVRVSALMVTDGKIFLAKSPKDEYYLLGGAILVNELSEEAIKREVYEEAGVAVEVGDLAFVVENHFIREGVNYHQIEFLYWVTPLSEPSVKMQEGGQTRQCEWVSLDALEVLNLNPAFLKTQLKNWDGHLKHFVNKDGED